MRNFIYIAIALALFGFTYHYGWSELAFPKRVRSIDSANFINTTLILDIIQFVIIHVFLLILLFIFLFLISKSLTSNHRRYDLPAFFIITLIALFNMIGYVRNTFPRLELSKLFISPFYENLGLYSGSLVILFITLSVYKYIKENKQIIAIYILVVGLLFLSPYYKNLIDSNIFFSNKIISSSLASTQTSSTIPDIFIIGLDSVSYRQLKDSIDHLPNIKNIIYSGTSFTEAYTPLARTGPAWNSVLTGRYPVNSGVRFNLNFIKESIYQNNLVRNISQKGYTTFYAQDERRFNNINSDYGFDDVVGPKLGSSDFIIPNFSDNVISAYFTDSLIGQWLFPNLYTNRVSDKTYKPEQFSHSVVDRLKKIDGPIFLAVHHCLAHFPYSWHNSGPSNADEIFAHKNSLAKLDQQVGILMDYLRSSHRLENSIIILLSDHGEGLGQELDLWYEDDSDYSNPHRFIRGHGGSIASKDQYNIVLHVSTPKDRMHDTLTVDDGLASLVDLRTTIETMIGIENDGYEGMDLFQPRNNR
ncbi:MAG: sulfatase-like hydrolase/transferase, partial [Oleibacter sp.]|nr:sulfatase-like hydrolase/transferase [Thalassolituus sp.]